MLTWYDDIPSTMKSAFYSFHAYHVNGYGTLFLVFIKSLENRPTPCVTVYQVIPTRNLGLVLSRIFLILRSPTFLTTSRVLLPNASVESPNYSFFHFDSPSSLTLYNSDFWRPCDPRGSDPICTSIPHTWKEKWNGRRSLLYHCLES